MNQKAWIDVGSPRFSYLQPIQHIGVVASGAKPVISPTYLDFMNLLKSFDIILSVGVKYQLI
jgi:hypothetical protein